MASDDGLSCSSPTKRTFWVSRGKMKILLPSLDDVVVMRGYKRLPQVDITDSSLISWVVTRKGAPAAPTEVRAHHKRNKFFRLPRPTWLEYTVSDSHFLISHRHRERQVQRKNSDKAQNSTVSSPTCLGWPPRMTHGSRKNASLV
jgi:hypothetical protein